MIERQKRKIAPTIRSSQVGGDERAAKATKADPERHARLRATQESMRLSASLGRRTASLSFPQMRKLAKLGDAVLHLLD